MNRQKVSNMEAIFICCRQKLKVCLRPGTQYFSFINLFTTITSVKFLPFSLEFHRRPVYNRKIDFFLRGEIVYQSAQRSMWKQSDVSGLTPTFVFVGPEIVQSILNTVLSVKCSTFVFIFTGSWPGCWSSGNKVSCSSRKLLKIICCNTQLLLCWECPKVLKYFTCKSSARFLG